VAMDLPKPHFTVVIDDTVGEIAALTVAEDGEITCTLHSSAADDDSPARYSGHTVFSKAVEVALSRFQGATADSPT